MFDRSLMYEAGGGDKVNIYRRDALIEHEVLREVNFIQVPPTSEDTILPTGQVLSNPSHDAFIPLTEEQLTFVEEYIEDNKCLPVMVGDVIHKSEDCVLHITRVDFGSGWILLDVEEEANY